MIRWMVRLVLLAGVAWCGYWFIGARTVEGFARDWIAAQSAAGLVAEEQGLDVTGFPNRFDVTLTEPRLADPRAGWGWQAEFLQLFSLSYRPWHVIAAFSPRQTVTLQGQSVTVEAGKLQGSVVVEPGTSLPLQRSTLAGETLRLTPDAGPALQIAGLRFGSEADPGDLSRHRIGLEASGLAMEGGPAAARIELARLDAWVTFSGPIDRQSLARPPEMTAIDLREAILNWGDVSAFARGTVATDLAGIATGEITLRLENWSAALDRLVDLGVVPASNLSGLRQIGQVLSLTSGDGRSVELPLKLSPAGVTVGGFPVAPPLRMR
jgi:hypothetical protein